MPSALLSSAAGRRSLLYTIIPRSTRHFTPAIISALAATDLIRAKTSKKDENARREETRAAASPGLLALIKQKGVEMSRDPKGSLVVAEIMLFTEGGQLFAPKFVFCHSMIFLVEQIKLLPSRPFLSLLQIHILQQRRKTPIQSISPIHHDYIKPYYRVVIILWHLKS